MKNKNLKIHLTDNFKKKFAKLPKKIQEKTITKDTSFKEDPFTPSLKTHKLKGSLRDYWAYSIDYRYRILFKFVSDEEIIYFDIGTHEVYK